MTFAASIRDGWLEWGARDLDAVVGQRRSTWHAGPYLGHGFHEDGLASAVRVARGLGVAIPWEGSWEGLRGAARRSKTHTPRS